MSVPPYLRFTIRPPEPDSPATLLLGAVNKVAIEALGLQPGVVYEIVDIAGERVLREVGPSALPPEKWGKDVSSIVRECLHETLGTPEEVERFLGNLER